MDARKSKKDQIKTKLRNRLIHSACRTGDIQKVRSLLQNDFDCKFDEDQREKMIPYLGGGVSPMHCAAEQGNHEIVETLLQHGGDVNNTSSTGLIPLHHTFILKDPPSLETVRLLIEYGTDINRKCEKKNTPLHFACRQKHSDNAVRLLLEHGADLTIKNEYLETPLHLALITHNIEVAKLLVEYGADLHSKDKNHFGETLEELADRLNVVHIWNILLKHEEVCKVQRDCVRNQTAEKSATVGKKKKRNKKKKKESVPVIDSDTNSNTNSNTNSAALEDEFDIDTSSTKDDFEDKMLQMNIMEVDTDVVSNSDNDDSGADVESLEFDDASPEVVSYELEIESESSDDEPYYVPRDHPNPIDCNSEENKMALSSNQKDVSAIKNSSEALNQTKRQLHEKKVNNTLQTDNEKSSKYDQMDVKEIEGLENDVLKKMEESKSKIREVDKAAETTIYKWHVELSRMKIEIANAEDRKLVNRKQMADLDKEVEEIRVKFISLQEQKDRIETESSALDEKVRSLNNVKEDAEKKFDQEMDTNKAKQKRLHSSLSSLEEELKLIKVEKEKKVEIKGASNIGCSCKQPLVQAISNTPIDGSTKLLQDFLNMQISNREKDLECSVCKKVCQVPIYTCPEQHIVCSNCWENKIMQAADDVAKCTDCGVQYPQPPRHHRTLEKLHEELQQLYAMQRQLTFQQLQSEID